MQELVVQIDNGPVRKYSPTEMPQVGVKLGYSHQLTPAALFNQHHWVLFGQLESVEQLTDLAVDGCSAEAAET